MPRTEGVETKQIKTSYSTAAGTAYITFDNVKVPAENMLGPEDGGLLVILSNFNVSSFMNVWRTKRALQLIIKIPCSMNGVPKYISSDHGSLTDMYKDGSCAAPASEVPG